MTSNNDGDEFGEFGEVGPLLPFSVIVMSGMHASYTMSATAIDSAILQIMTLLRDMISFRAFAPTWRSVCGSEVVSYRYCDNTAAQGSTSCTSEQTALASRGYPPCNLQNFVFVAEKWLLCCKFSCLGAALVGGGGKGFLVFPTVDPIQRATFRSELNGSPCWCGICSRPVRRRRPEEHTRACRWRQ